MKRFTVPSSNVSFNDDLFGTNRPFEASTTKSALQMRARRSPDLVSNPISINSHIRGRAFYWFTSNWNLTVNNGTFSTIDNIDVRITANHIGGKSRTVNTFISNIEPNESFNTTISPPNVGFNNMIMDSSNNPSLNFQVDFLATLPSDSSAFIEFNWGGTLSESSDGTSLTTTTRDLLTWLTNGKGVNVNITILGGTDFSGDSDGDPTFV